VEVCRGEDDVGRKDDDRESKSSLALLGKLHGYTLIDNLIPCAVHPVIQAQFGVNHQPKSTTHKGVRTLMFTSAPPFSLIERASVLKPAPAISLWSIPNFEDRKTGTGSPDPHTAAHHPVDVLPLV